MKKKTLAEAKPKMWEFYDSNFVPKGKVILLAGQGGSGKSTFMSWLADRISSESVRVLIVSNEEDTGILAARANPFTEVTFASSKDDNESKNITREEIIEELANFDVIFVDSLRTVVKGDLRHSHIVEEELTPFIQAVAGTEKSIVLLTHTNKGGGDSIQDMINGSERLVSCVRHCNLTINDRIGNRRFITIAKTNDPSGRTVNKTFSINPIEREVLGEKILVVNNITPFDEDIDLILYANSSKGKMQRYHKLLFNSDTTSDRKNPPKVIMDVLIACNGKTTNVDFVKKNCSYSSWVQTLCKPNNKDRWVVRKKRGTFVEYEWTKESLNWLKENV